MDRTPTFHKQDVGQDDLNDLLRLSVKTDIIMSFINPNVNIRQIHNNIKLDLFQPPIHPYLVTSVISQLARPASSGALPSSQPHPASPLLSLKESNRPVYLSFNMFYKYIKHWLITKTLSYFNRLRHEKWTTCADLKCNINSVKKAQPSSQASPRLYCSRIWDAVQGGGCTGGCRG